MDYVNRCKRGFTAEIRSFQREQDLLGVSNGELGRGASGFWIADTMAAPLSSEQFARGVQGVRDGGLRLLLLGIGPANGWSAAAQAAADLRFSLGAMTLPHELAALVLAEQVYRASTILQGHPYHLGH